MTNVEPSEGDRTWLLDTPGGRDSSTRRADDPFRLMARGGCLCSWEAAVKSGAWRQAAEGPQVMAKHCGHAAGRRLGRAGRDMAQA